MKNSTYLFVSFLFAKVMLIFTINTAFAQDAVEVSPNNYKVLLENDRVRVLEVRYKPGEKSPLHYHPANVVITLTDGVARHIDTDGQTSDAVFKAGKVFWRKPGIHAAANPDTTEFHLIFVELKEPEKKKKE